MSYVMRGYSNLRGLMSCFIDIPQQTDNLMSGNKCTTADQMQKSHATSVLSPLKI